MDQVGHGHFFVMGITVGGQESKKLSHRSGSFREGTHLFLALPCLSPLVYSRPNSSVSDGDGMTSLLRGPEYVCSAETKC